MTFTDEERELLERTVNEPRTHRSLVDLVAMQELVARFLLEREETDSHDG